MSTDPNQFSLNGPTMGTRWSAVGHAVHPIDRSSLDAALAEACHRVDSQMSTWNPQSALMQLNRMPVGQWMEVPEELAYVLALGEGVRQRSGGLFDMAVLAEVQAAGFGSDIAVDPARTISRDQPSLEIDMPNLRVRRLVPAAFDLSGIAKGFGVDLLARTMEQFGINDYLVAIDGELQAGGFRPDGRPWAVALEAPLDGRRDIAARLELHNASLATSGTYRHGRREGERWVSHTIDPRSGQPAATDLTSVTVQMPDCVLADAWATVLLVAGRVRAGAICREQGLSAILMASGDAGLERIGFGSFAA